MGNPFARIELVDKDPEMDDIRKVLFKAEGRKIVKTCVSWSDDQGRMEEARMLLDDGTELRIISTAVAWYENERLVRVLPGSKTGTLAEYDATDKVMPHSGLAAFREEPWGPEWSEMLKEETDPKERARIKRALDKSLNGKRKGKKGGNK